MREYNEYVARAAVCEQRAKDARTESEKQSWLVMADSWRETVKLQEMLTRHAEFIRKVPRERIDQLLKDHYQACARQELPPRLLATLKKLDEERAELGEHVQATVETNE